MSTKLLAILSMMGAWLVSEMARAAEVTRNFETNSLSGLRVAGNAPSVQGSIKRLGRYGMRSYLHKSTSAVSYRTEARVIAPDPNVNQEYWYSFSIYLPDDYVPDTVWEIVAQWHAIPDTGEPATNPPLSLSTAKGIWKLYNKATADRITKSGNVQTRSFTFGTYARGRWTDWVFRIRWSYGSQGILEAWKNGQKVLSANGPNTYNDARMPYFKMGIYKGWKAGATAGVVTQRTLYHDEFRMVGPGGSYGAVAPSTLPTTLLAPAEFAVE